jgi:predicted ATPase
VGLRAPQRPGATELARRVLDELVARGWALADAAMVHQLRGDVRALDDAASRTAELSSTEGFPFFRSRARMHRGWAQTSGGGAREGLAELREGLAEFSAIGLEFFRPFWLSLLADGCRRTGAFDDGLAALSEALASVERTGGRWWEAELHRLRGELALARGGEAEEAEVCFRRALSVARDQGAKSLELRAATSLGRLCARSGRGEEAAPLLAELYTEFEEGLDTPDLVDARELLEELRA